MSRSLPFASQLPTGNENTPTPPSTSESRTVCWTLQPGRCFQRLCSWREGFLDACFVMSRTQNPLHASRQVLLCEALGSLLFILLRYDEDLHLPLRIFVTRCNDPFIIQTPSPLAPPWSHLKKQWRFSLLRCDWRI
jgi:hypothetical protein